MTRFLSDPSLARYDPKIERTLLHLRKARRRLAFGGGEKVSTNSPTISKVDSESAFEEGTVYSSKDTTNNSSIDLGTDTMAAPRRVTLKEAGAPDFVLQPTHIRHPVLNANFDLKTALINLLPKYQGLSRCRAKEWFYSLPSEIVGDWDLPRREFLDKFFPAAVTDKLRKEISCIVQGELETLYEYWEQFRKLLDSCPNHMIDTLVLISYFCQGMKLQDKIFLDASSNGSLTKYRTAEEAWQLISDLAESTLHARQRSNHPRAVYEVSSSGETATLTKTLCEMTSLLKQLQVNQQQPPSHQQPPPPPQHQQSQQLVPQRVCGICSCYSHYTDECPNLQDDNTLAATHNFYDRPFYDRPNQGYYSQGGNYNQGSNNFNQSWKDNSNQGWRDNYQQGGRDNGGNQKWEQCTILITIEEDN
ncbi:uncharacterized protein DS421_12g372260 [Arachis hypogaea]|nr:uncharacterized protein DS421_12g372260 [Arachis hypogaea]